MMRLNRLEIGFRATFILIRSVVIWVPEMSITSKIISPYEAPRENRLQVIICEGCRLQIYNRYDNDEDLKGCFPMARLIRRYAIPCNWVIEMAIDFYQHAFHLHRLHFSLIPSKPPLQQNCQEWNCSLWPF